jgi:hypothetical protein
LSAPMMCPGRHVATRRQKPAISRFVIVFVLRMCAELLPPHGEQHFVASRHGTARRHIRPCCLGSGRP